MGTLKKKNILEIINITKRFGNSTAIDNISFSLEHGKLMTFVGPSGCGKTTLLRMISGFTEPTEGKIILDGKDITYLKANRRDTAMVFQNYALFPHMSVAQNIGFGLRVQKRPKHEIRKEIDRLLELVQLEGLGSRLPQKLSGGQQQRVALARSLSLNPKILLLDEPLSNLDANLRVLMREEIRKLQQRLNLSIVFVTHDQEEAMSISDIIVVMDNGTVRQIGPPNEIYEHPNDEFVANFIGHINLFKGEVTHILPNKMTLNTPYGDLNIGLPDFDISLGDNLKAVVRPESIKIKEPGQKREEENTFVGRIESSMYIGSLMRYKVQLGGKNVYIDESDPQYTNCFADGDNVALLLKKNIHLLRA